MALFLVQYTMVTIEALTATLGSNSKPFSSSSDLDGEWGDMGVHRQLATRNAIADILLSDKPCHPCLTQK